MADQRLAQLGEGAIAHDRFHTNAGRAEGTLSDWRAMTDEEATHFARRRQSPPASTLPGPLVRAKSRYIVSQSRQGHPVCAVEPEPALPVEDQQPRFSQDLEMLRHCCQRKIRQSRQIAGGALFVKACPDEQPSIRMGQGAENLVEFLLLQNGIISG